MERILDPKKIEEESFRIVERLMPKVRLSDGEREVLKRVIHTTTDISYAKELIFHPEAVERGLAAIMEGRPIICDVSMVSAGINKKILSSFGRKVICLIDDENIIREASALKIARAILVMRKASVSMDGAIVSIGNAPTALFELCDLVRGGKARPALIIGVPVGFVGASDSKKELISLSVPYITNSGTKGGSSVAAAITNALLIMARKRR